MAPLAAVDCVCGKRFCFQCRGDTHGPASCGMLAAWEQRVSADAASAAYLMTNTVNCPTCHNGVEKSTGCNLMTCRCGQYFCYLCGEKTGLAHTWTTIQGHECGRYRSEARDNSLESMRRFMFYHKRWAVHDDSRRREQELMRSIELRVQELLSARGEPIEMRLAVRIEEALIRLTECRRILANSYIFCFYAFGDDPKLNHGLSAEEIVINQPLFEDFQQALESRLEVLSALMDKVGNAADVDPDDVLSITKVYISALSKLCAHA